MPRTIAMPIVTRRRLLQAASLITGSMILPGLAAAAAAAAPGRTGLIVPPTPQGEEFLTALRLALPAADLILHRTEPTRLAMSRATAKLLAGGADRLVGMIGPNIASGLASQLEAARVPLLAVDSGANLVRKSEESPWIQYHTLGLWRGAAALGAWAARHHGPRGLVLSGIIESGYDMLHAFELGLAHAGGSPLPAVVTHTPPDPVDWPAVLAQVAAARPDVVYALYSGEAGVAFLQAWRSSGLRIPLVASPFLVADHLLARHGSRSLGLTSAAPWAPSLATEASQRFVTAFTGATGAQPGAFGLLGYETGLLLAGGPKEIESPRGWIRPGPTGSTRSPLYRRTVEWREGVLQNKVVGPLPILEETDGAFAELRSALRSGWTAPYLA